MTNRADHTCQGERPQLVTSGERPTLRARSMTRAVLTLLAGFAALDAHGAEPFPALAAPAAPIASAASAESEIDPASPAFVLPENISAAATIVEASYALDELTQAEVSAATEQLSHRDFDVRRSAAARLAWIGPSAAAAVPALLECLSDSEVLVRAHAAKALWDIDRRREAIPVLIELLDATDPAGRPLASYFLGHIGPAAEESLPVLHRCLDAASGMERVHLAEAIARINSDDARAVRALIEGLRDTAPEVRFVAAYALGDVSLRHREDIVPALSAAQHDSDDAVSTAATLALQAFRAPARYTGDVIIFEAAAVAALQNSPAQRSGPASGAGSDPAGGAVGFPEPHCLELRSITQVSLNIAPPVEGPSGEARLLPYNHFVECFDELGTFDHGLGYSRTWMLTAFQWQATAFCHRPLYFEEPNLERLGYSHGFWQPLVSAGHFFGRIPALPYLMHADPYCECDYTLGQFRPGSCAPYLCHRPPMSLHGATAQAVVTTALFLAIY